MNEWTPWQLKNLNAIVWLHRGERDKYKKLLEEYDAEMLNVADETGDVHLYNVIAETKGYDDIVALIETYLTERKEEAKAAVAEAGKRDKKKTEAMFAEQIAMIEELLSIAKEALWLTEKFGLDGTYQDVLGLCKVETIENIAQKEYSLTPGVYVGVAPVADDGVDFKTRMAEIRTELMTLQTEANTLTETIFSNLEEMGI